MKRREFIKITGFAMAGATTSLYFSCNQKPVNHQRPNFLFIFTDDQGYGDLSCHGNQYLETPSLDQLAKESIEFTNFHACPLCAPSRASLLTGRQFLRTGVWGVHRGHDYMNLDKTTFAEVLQHAGYRTAMIGKWHNGKPEAWKSWNRGFDEGWEAHLYSHENCQINHNGEVSKLKGWTTDRLTDIAIDFMEQNKNQPFFCYLSYLAPHAPWYVPPDYVQKYMNKGLAEPIATCFGMIDNIDTNVGRLTQALDRLGLAENTVLIFTSDNGPINEAEREWGKIGEENFQKRNPMGLRGRKGEVWENGTRVPFFVRWKNKFKPAIIDRNAHLVDMFPTFLDLAGIPIPENNKQLDGKSLKPLFEGKVKDWQDRLIFSPKDEPYWQGKINRDSVLPDKSAIKYENQILSVEQKFLLHLNKNVINLFSLSNKNVAYLFTMENKMEQNLLLQNPWWDNADLIQNDPHLKRVDELPFQYQSQVITDDDLHNSGVITLRGPRQVGKTTFLKMLIRKLLQDESNPQNIFYFSTDLVANEKELFSLIHDYIQFAPQGKRFIFFDEITMVDRWEYAIKHVVDLGLAEDILFILTGSSSFDLRRGGERLPGRRLISKPDRVLLPLSFREYCLLQNFNEAESLSIQNWYDSLLEKLPRLRVFFPKIQSYFQQYLRYGGFLMAISDFLKNGAIHDPTLETYKTVVVSDFEKLKKDRIILRNIIRHLINTLATPISWNGLAQNLGSISVNTVREYIQLLADSFSIFILEFLEKDHQRPSARKNKKLFPFDPFVYQVFSSIAGQNLQESIQFESKKIEGIVGSALLRVTESELFHGFANLMSTFYWRSARGKEIDFVVIWNDKEVPIEVKYQSRIIPNDYTTIKRSFGKGVVLTKDSFFQDEAIIGLPVSCFLYLLAESMA